MRQNLKFNTNCLMLNKKTPISLFLFLAYFNGYSQISLNDLPSIGLGTSFKNHEWITQQFTSKAEFYKGDFLNTHRIDFKNAPFDHYGNADYEFHYVDDKLIAYKVIFLFKADELDNFERVFKTLLEDIRSDSLYTHLKAVPHINEQETISKIRKYCILTKKKGDQDYKRVNIGTYGLDLWTFGNIYTSLTPYLMMSVSLNQFEEKDCMACQEYNGGQVNVTLLLSNYEYKDFVKREQELVHKYELFEADSLNEVPLKFVDNVYKLPVNLNGAITIDFVLDLGASDVSISPDIFLVLYKAGTIKDEDFIGTQTYQFADGSTAKSNVFLLKSLQFGDFVLKNVRTSVSNSINSPLLLGQSALKKLKSYRIDNTRSVLIVE